MKRKTKELIKWAMSLIADYRVQNMVEHSNFRKNTPAAQNSEVEIKNCKDFAEFLNSLPEFESHLCRGGYIQDRNGTPCCDGDEILINGEFEAVLKWIAHTGNNPDKMPHFGFQWKCDVNTIDELPSFWIKKVEK